MHQYSESILSVIHDIYNRDFRFVDCWRWIPAPANSCRGRLNHCGDNGLGIIGMPGSASHTISSDNARKEKYDFLHRKDKDLAVLSDYVWDGINSSLTPIELLPNVQTMVLGLALRAFSPAPEATYLFGGLLRNLTSW